MQQIQCEKCGLNGCGADIPHACIPNAPTMVIVRRTNKGNAWTWFSRNKDAVVENGGSHLSLESALLAAYQAHASNDGDLLAICKMLYSALMNETSVGVRSTEKRLAATVIANTEGRRQ